MYLCLEAGPACAYYYGLLAFICAHGCIEKIRIEELTGPSTSKTASWSRRLLTSLVQNIITL